MIQLARERSGADAGENVVKNIQLIQLGPAQPFAQSADFVSAIDGIKLPTRFAKANGRPSIPPPVQTIHGRGMISIPFNSGFSMLGVNVMSSLPPVMSTSALST